ncbi:MAG: transglycosylase SLT domain-containing protein [Hydrogenophaga sp.]|nr:transglycosylase SLT domain-containing protein [Hydrogenophaga sp.]
MTLSSPLCTSALPCIPLPHPAPIRPATPARRGGLGALLIAWTLVLGACATVAPDASNSGALPAPMAEASRANAAVQPLSPIIPSGPLSTITTSSTSLPAVVTLAAPTDLWDRIRRGLSMPDLDTDLVRDREQWYASRPDYITRMTERSARYLFHIVEEIERRNLPMELALLPFIESAFNPQAVSSARAAGIWQFMPATGESFDLKQNIFRDDRRDVLASTRAALDYLEQLHARFGDWHLALAAYNWGQGNVNRAITRNQREGLPTGYTDLTMPMETRMYVPKLQAVENIIANPQAFRAQLPLIGNHPFFDTVTLDRDMDVAVIARLSEVSEKDFRALNPSLKHPVVMAAGMPNILLPWDNAGIFERNLKTHTGPLASWTAWLVPTTMTVAQAAERAGMTESELRSVNHIPPRMLVRAGSSLLVPRNGRHDGDVPIQLADNGHLSLQAEVILRRTVVKARKGENVARLAGRYGVSPASVAGWNQLAANAALKPGQSVVLMLPRSAASSSSAGVQRRKLAPAPATARKAPPVKAVASRPPVKTAAKRPGQATNPKNGTRVASTAKPVQSP